MVNPARPLWPAPAKFCHIQRGHAGVYHREESPRDARIAGGTVLDRIPTPEYSPKSILNLLTEIAYSSDVAIRRPVFSPATW